MARHKHEPKGINAHLGDQIIEKCEMCGMRRVITISSRTSYSRWVTKEESEKYMLSWLWRY
jgi:hypothetical protein